MRAVYGLLANLARDEEVVFQDEKQLDLNPPVGGMWMKRGEQAEVPTPGQNQRAYISASLSWRTGRIEGMVVRGSRNSGSFIDHLKKLRQT